MELAALTWTDGARDPRRAKLRRLRARLRLRPWRALMVMGVVAVFSVMFVGAAIGLVSLFPGRGSGYVILAAWAVLAFLMIIALEALPGSRRTGWLNARVAGIGLCVGCGYDLTGLGAEPDGCSVCPECGAAWRLDVLRPRAPRSSPAEAP